MSGEQTSHYRGLRRSTVAGAALVVAAGLIAGGCSSRVPLSRTQQDMIIAYKLGATGKLPDTVGS